MIALRYREARINIKPYPYVNKRGAEGAVKGRHSVKQELVPGLGRLLWYHSQLDFIMYLLS